MLEAYSYDHWNNRRSTTASDNSVKAYIYDTNDPKKLKEIRQTDANGDLLASFAYDDNGNIITKTEDSATLTLSYDALNRLSIASKTGSPTETYKYDPQGNRIEKTVGGNTTYYRYQGPDIAAQYDNGWTEADYNYTHGPQWDDPLIRSDATDMSQYYHQDGLGSVVSTTNMAGTIEATARYDACGVTKESSGNIPQYGYTGREPDATGLMYYRTRYYDPAIGRFTQRDPKGYIDGVNRYAYAINNPVNYTDPRGTDALNVGSTNAFNQSVSYCSSCGGTRIDLGLGSGSGGMSSGSQSLISNAVPPMNFANNVHQVNTNMNINNDIIIDSVSIGSISAKWGLGSINYTYGKYELDKTNPYNDSPVVSRNVSIELIGLGYSKTKYSYDVGKSWTDETVDYAPGWGIGKTGGIAYTPSIGIKIGHVKAERELELEFIKGAN